MRDLFPDNFECMTERKFCFNYEPAVSIRREILAHYYKLVKFALLGQWRSSATLHFEGAFGREPARQAEGAMPAKKLKFEQINCRGMGARLSGDTGCPLKSKELVVFDLSPRL